VPDFQWIHTELAKKGVTLTLLWDEYCRKVRTTGGIPYMYNPVLRQIPSLGSCDEGYHAHYHKPEMPCR
jgi:hypothetical protein